MSEKDKGTEEVSEFPEITKVSFAPGVLEHLEETMSIEELQDLMDNIGEMIKDGSFLSEATLVDMDELEQSDPEMYAAIMKSLNEVDDVPVNNPVLH